jgi:hypothetical protein
MPRPAVAVGLVVRELPIGGSASLRVARGTAPERRIVTSRVGLAFAWRRLLLSLGPLLSS